MLPKATDMQTLRLYYAYLKDVMERLRHEAKAQAIPQGSRPC